MTGWKQEAAKLPHPGPLRLAGVAQSDDTVSLIIFSLSASSPFSQSCRPELLARKERLTANDNHASPV